MISLTNKQLDNISGGEITLTGIFIVSAVVVFVSGIIDGIVNPKGCSQ